MTFRKLFLRKNASYPRARVRTPVVIQFEASECGAACLGIVLGYFGLHLPLEQLRLACGVSRDGSRANNILKAARSFGLTSRGLKAETETLHTLRLPLILFWNFNHFVVLEGWRGETIFLNDPAGGRRSVSPEEFDQSFTGVVLEFEKGRDFCPRNSVESMTRLFLSRIRGAGSALTFVVLATFALAIPGLILPIFWKVFVDNILIAGSKTWLPSLLCAMTIVMVMAGSLTFLQQHCLALLQRFLALTAGTKFFWHVLRLPIQFFSQRSPAEISSRVALNDKFASLVSGKIATSLAALLLLGLYAPLLFRYDSLLTWIGIGACLINFIALRVISTHRKQASISYLQERGKLMSTSVSGLQLIETLKATGNENDFFARWAGHHAKANNAQLLLARCGLFLQLFPALTSAGMTAAILALGGSHVMDGAFTLGSLMAFEVLMSSFLTPVGSLLDTGATIQEAEAELRRLEDVLSYPAIGGRPATEVSHCVPLRGGIEVKNITFGYSRLEPPLLENLSLRISPGQRVALIGLSGSGKSTLCRLIAGLFEPWSGEILFDGQPRGSIPTEVFSESLAFVDQDTAFFSGTIAENISLWDETLDAAMMIEAAKDACIHDDILTQEGNYGGKVEEDARNFSGGQRLRLEIARALIRNPRILILDEATSMLDAAIEERVDHNLRRRGCTCVISAHRLSTIRDADELVILDQGRIVERGSHHALLALNGAYSRLIATN